MSTRDPVTGRFLKADLTWKELEELFWSKVNFSDSCWIWTAGHSTNKSKIKYGAFWFNGKNIGAHQASWIFSNGPIPEGLNVLHNCDVMSCVKPSHLFIGSLVLNAKDRHNKDRDAKGEKNGNSKLIEGQVRDIKQRINLGLSIKDIADHFNVTPQTIASIRDGKTWNWLM